VRRRGVVGRARFHVGAGRQCTVKLRVKKRIAPVVDGVRGNPGIEQLGTGEHAVLVCREASNGLCGHFAAYRAAN
jgi:hypothetical protein